MTITSYNGGDDHIKGFEVNGANRPNRRSSRTSKHILKMQEEEDDRHDQLSLFSLSIRSGKHKPPKQLPTPLSFVFIKPIMLPELDSNFALDEAKINQLDSDNKTLFEEKLSFCHDYDIEFQIGKFFSITRYSMKFTVDFIFTELNESMFNAFLCKLQLAMQQDKIKMEFPPTAINALGKEFHFATMLFPEYHMEFQEIGIGSLINLSYFARHVLQSYPPGVNLQKNTLKIKFENNKLIFDFYLGKAHFKLDMSFMIIQRIVLQMPEMNDPAYYLFLHISNSPILVCDEDNGLHIEWVRTNHFNKNGTEEIYDSNLFGMARAYFVKIPIVDGRGRRDPLKNINIYENILYMAQQCKENNKTFSFHIAEIEHIESDLDHKVIFEEVETRFRDQFDILYASLVLFSRSYTVADQLNLEYQEGLKKFLQLIEEYSKDNAKVVEECLYSLELQCREEIVNIKDEFSSLVYDRLKFQERKIKKKSLLEKDEEEKRESHMLVRRAVLTPSQLYFERPTPLMKSRFSKLARGDYTLRITVLEDNFRRFNKNISLKEREFLKKSIESRLMDGIEIGDRVYHFLGSSSSQMKDNGMLLYAKDDKGHDANWIRSEAGDLSQFNRNRAKFVARLGLIFSQAITRVNLDNYQVKTYKTADIKGDFKPTIHFADCPVDFTTTKPERYNFSDGAGIISEDLANIVTEQLAIPGGYKPSAFQIRYGGCKGMLSTFPGLPSTTILFRESMIKYTSPDRALGILKYAYPRSVFLNRPLIMILDQVGVSSEIFYQFFASNTTKIACAFLNPFEALSLIMTYRNEHLPYIKLFRNGISLLHEPFFRRILIYLAFYRLNQLKLKARIKVPEENGRMAFGVVDETTSLEYGQVFFQYTELDREGNPIDKTHVLEGEVMVTKFPCLQPGDVRKLVAVNTPELYHIKDCIVFPGKGERPHPDEMGGSDLDGDEYAVFWNSKLIFPNGNEKSMHFPTGNKEVLDHDIMISDVVNFYTEYLMNNNMGQVANSHLMYSDFHPKGLFSDECANLAIKYSIALDYQKTGFNCNLPNEYLFLHKSLRPDFMKKPGTCTLKVYLSKRILGQFYRQCCLIEEVLTLSEKFLNVSNQLYSKPTTKFVLPGWKNYTLQAEEAFIEYRSRVVEIMEQLNLDGETMLLSDVYDDRSDITTILLANLFSDFQAKFAQQAANLELHERPLLASAWYSICFEPRNMMNFQYKNQPLLGLPWTIPNEIIAILSHQMHKIFEEEKTDFDMQDEWIKLDSFQFDKYDLDFTQLDDREQSVLLTTIKLVMAWITRIYDIIYKREFEALLDLHNRKGWTRGKENDLLQDIVKDFLIKLYRKTYSQTKKIQSDRELVCFLFNQFMLYLYHMCNSVDQFIRSGSISELLLIRFGVFALGFVNQSDKLFALQQNGGQVEKHSGQSDNSSLEWNEEQFDSLFNNFLMNSHSIKEQVNDIFYMLQPNTKLNLDSICRDEVQIREFNQKMCFFAGVNAVKVFYEQLNMANVRFHTVFKGNQMKPLPVEQTHKFSKMQKIIERTPNDIYYRVVTCGLPVSIRFLHSLLGHPNFYDNIYTKFQLLKPE